jgi:multiple sugar transport system permease protein
MSKRVREDLRIEDLKDDRSFQVSIVNRQAAGQLGAATLFLLPNFLGFLAFTAGPVLVALFAAFTNWDLQEPGKIHWIGFENFRELLHDKNFWLYFINTLYLMLGIPLAIAGSLILAMLLHEKLPGVVAYRTLFYLPTFTAGVALMLMWKAMLNPDWGPINAIISFLLKIVGLGHVQAPGWLGSMSNILGLKPESIGVTGKFFGLGARDAIILMGVWTVIGGNNMLLYLAALSNVPQDLYEAADIDGAGSWQKFWNVTWPQLAPTTFFIVVMSVIGGLQGGFEQARVLTQGKPASTTVTLAYYIYQKAFEQYQMGYASSIAWVLFVMVFGFTLVYWRAAGKELGY